MSNGNCPATEFLPQNGSGIITIEGSPYTLVVVNEGGTDVFYNANGGSPDTPLPQGPTSFPAQATPFNLGWNGGNFKLAWFFQQPDAAGNAVGQQRTNRDQTP